MKRNIEHWDSFNGLRDCFNIYETDEGFITALKSPFKIAEVKSHLTLEEALTERDRIFAIWKEERGKKTGCLKIW
jgi:hypothetical protein